MQLDEKLIAPFLVTAFSLIVAAWAWLLRRWVTKADQLHKDVDQLRLQAAVRDERLTHLVGALEVLRRTVQDQAAANGVLAGAVEKMWIVLQAKGLIEARHSDEVLVSAAKRGWKP